MWTHTPAFRVPSFLRTPFYFNSRKDVIPADMIGLGGLGKVILGWNVLWGTVTAAETAVNDRVRPATSHLAPRAVENISVE